MTHPRPPAGWVDRYEAVASVRAAARLSTATKAFCNCAVADAAEPNANTCPVCLGLPGAQPVLNARAVELAVRAALALGSSVQLASGFSREHHAADPARPKGYVLTQQHRPLATHGSVQIGESPTGVPISVGIRCAHLTEQLATAVHERFAGASGFDYNLAGAPLLVLEGAAELRSPAEVRAYVSAVARLLRAVGASEASLERGSLEVVAAVALRRLGDLAAGEACDVRNLRSLDDVSRAVGAECARQATAMEAGNSVEPRSLLWDAAAGELRVARVARQPPAIVLVEPDLPPLLLTREWIEQRRRELPELPTARRTRLGRAYGLDPATLDVFVEDGELADYYETVARLHGDGQSAAAWMQEHVIPLLAREGWTTREYAVRVRPADLVSLLDARRAGEVTHDAAARVFATMARTGEAAPKAARRSGYVVDD